MSVSKVKIKTEKQAKPLKLAMSFDEAMRCSLLVSPEKAAKHKATKRKQ